MKIKNAAKAYVLITQGIITMFVMAGLGYLIGWLILPDTFLPGLLAGIGIIVGVFIFVSYILYLIKGEEKNNESNSKN